MSRASASYSASMRIASVLLIGLLFLTVIPRGVSQTTPCPASIVVTYISATPHTVEIGNMLSITFRAIYFTSEPYLGCISHPAVGLQTATFLVSSAVKEYPNTPLTPGAIEGEYHAEITLAEDIAPGQHEASIKMQSLEINVGAINLTGPVADTGSDQTEETSDLSWVDVTEKPSVWTQLLQGNELILVLLALIVILLLIVAVFARRRRKPAQADRK